MYAWLLKRVNKVLLSKATLLALYVVRHCPSKLETSLPSQIVEGAGAVAARPGHVDQDLRFRRFRNEAHDRAGRCSLTVGVLP